MKCNLVPNEREAIQVAYQFTLFIRPVKVYVVLAVRWATCAGGRGA